MFPIGHDRVGIVTETPSVEVDELMTPVSETESVEWKDGCSFQVINSSEAQTDTTTTSQVARVVMPVDDDTRRLTSASILRFGSDDYVMRGNPFLEVDQRGREQYVYGDCERQMG